LGDLEIKWKENKSSVCIVLASEGYPISNKNGVPILGLDNDYENTQIFHSGTKFNENGRVTTNGGRVLSITTIEDSLIEARDRIYSYIGKNIYFNGMQYRTDILKNEDMEK